jgi:hypothetical protein
LEYINVKKVEMHQDKCGWQRGVALLLAGYALAGCALPASPEPQVNPPSEGRSAMQPHVRVIILFERPTANNPQLTAAIAESCQCQPVFIRPYSNVALIYEIALPQGQTFVSFDKTLTKKASALGVKAVEQDFLMQHQ